MPLDYSKWKTIEVSDDEDETHPNIDTPSLFRWRHQARLERMAEAKQAREELEAKKKGMSDKVQEIETKLQDVDVSEKVRIKLEIEKQSILQQEEEFKRKERELEENEQSQPWNIDTIGHDVWNKSIVNKPVEKKTEEEKIVDDDEDCSKLLKFFDDNEKELKVLSLLDGFDQVESFLLEHPTLSSESSTSFLTIEALNLAMEEKFSEMTKVAENCITIQYILELAKSLNAAPSNTNLIKDFFKKIRRAQEAYMKLYTDEIEAFCDRIRHRAQEKREAAMKEVEAEDKAKRIAQAPGGLDPQEVFDSLPKEMQDAFLERDIGKMRSAAENMDIEEFEKHLQRCIDSGLWVANAKDDAIEIEPTENDDNKEKDADSEL